MAYDIFLSYSRSDSTFVDELYDKLVGLGYRVWVDREVINGGDAYKKRIMHGINEAKCMVFVSSHNSNKSEWTAKEISIAVKKKIPIIPIRIDDSEYNEEVEFDLITLDFVDLSKPDERDAQMGRFIKSIQKRVPLVDSGNPGVNLSPAAVEEKPSSFSDDIMSLKRKAEAGDRVSQYNLGICYSTGKGVPQNDEEAVKWFREAANRGEPGLSLIWASTTRKGKACLRTMRRLSSGIARLRKRDMPTL